MEELRFPVGKYSQPQTIGQELLDKWVETIRSFPEKVQHAVDKVSNEQLEKVYKPDGWNIRQLVHHLADSHMNAYIRFKLTLTEQKPTIKPYEQANWAMQADYQGSILPSLNIIEGVHERWAILLESMSANDFEKTYLHPEYNETYNLKEALCQYDWHCKHHLAHIELAKNQ